MRGFSLIAAVAVCLMASTTNIQADQYKQCSAEFDSCLKACDVEHGIDTAGRAACVPTCSGKYAACDAGVAYDKAKPWVEEQAGKTKKFFDDLMDKLKKDPPESQDTPADPDAPTKKSI